MQHVHTLVIGAGPTGLGAAWRLQEQHYDSWLVVEQADRPGGAAASVRDNRGFTWDLGGHVIHSHYPYFDQALAQSAVEWEYPQRNGFVFVADTFVPVPLQQNLAGLPAPLAARVVTELSQAKRSSPAANLDEWFRLSFGQTLTEEFFLPFNSKMWAHPPRLLDHQWTSLRSGSETSNVPPPQLGVAVVDRTHFPYPRHGSGALWAAVAKQLPAGRVRYRTSVTAIWSAAKVVELSDGTKLSYDNIISSMPLTELLPLVLWGRPPVPLLHSSAEVIGFGFDGPPPPALAEVSWVYHPDMSVPFHRATMLSNYSPAMAGPGRWSILLECGTSPTQRPLKLHSLVTDCLAVLQQWGAGKPVSTWRRHLSMGYPVPSLGRDQVLEPALHELEERNIRSRGRFGGWRYESCNQDYAFMQGVQAVDANELGSDEDVFWPNRVPIGAS